MVSQRRSFVKATAHFQKVLEFRRLSCLTTVLQFWHDYARFCRQRAVVFRRVIARVRHDNLSTTFQLWLADARKASKHRRIESRVASRWQKRALLSGFAWWYDETQAARERECSAFDFALDSWKIDRVTSEHDEQLKLMTDRFEIMHHRIVAVFMKVRGKQDLLSRFEAWRDHVTADQHRRRAVAEAVKRIEMVAYGTVFDGWLAWVWAEQSRRVLYQRALRRLHSLALGSAFNRWSRFTLWRAVSETALRKAQRKWLRKRSAEVFVAWHNHAVTSAVARHLLHKAAHRSRRGVCARVFNKWADQAEESHRLRIVAARIVRRLAHLQHHGVFARWLAFISFACRMRKLVARLHSLSKAAAFDTWTAAVEQWKAEKARAKHEAVLAAMRVDFQAVQDRVSQRMLDAKAKHLRTRCFAELRAYTSTKVRRRMLVDLAQQRLRDAALIGTFDAWFVWASGEKNMRRLHERSRRRHRNLLAVSTGMSRENRLGS